MSAEAIAAIKIEAVPDGTPIVVRIAGDDLLVTTILTISYGPP